MKFKTTNKALKNNYHYIIKIGYCDAQRLLANESPIAYNYGINGWQYDFYDIDGIGICTGYAPFGQNTKEDYKLVDEYEKKAIGLPFEDRRALLVELINQLKIK